MVTINPHTTRATGTVLTAAIYNADHQNHVTNATTINTDAAYKNVANTFTAAQTITELIISNLNGIHRDVTNSGLILSGGTPAGGGGANFELFGSTHATVPNQSFWDANTITVRDAAGTGNTNMTINGNLTVTGTLTGAAAAFPSGTVMLFQQTAAPTGWTKLTTHNNKALRLTTGTVTTGGSVAFTTAFASQANTGTIANTTATGTIGNTTSTGTVGGTALTEANLPAHSHGATGLTFTGDALPTHSHTISGGGFIYATTGSENVNRTGGTASHTDATINATSAGTPSGTIGGSTANAGSGTTHTHSLTMNAHNHSFTGTAHNHTYTGDSINLAVQFVDVIMASKD